MRESCGKESYLWVEEDKTVEAEEWDGSERQRTEARRVSSQFDRFGDGRAANDAESFAFVYVCSARVNDCQAE